MITDGLLPLNSKVTFNTIYDFGRQNRDVVGTLVAYNLTHRTFLHEDGYLYTGTQNSYLVEEDTENGFKMDHDVQLGHARLVVE